LQRSGEHLGEQLADDQDISVRPVDLRDLRVPSESATCNIDRLEFFSKERFRRVEISGVNRGYKSVRTQGSELARARRFAVIDVLQHLSLPLM
jgi:hypothetical protein